MIPFIVVPEHRATGGAMPWIYTYIRVNGEEVDMGPYPTREDAEEHRKEHARYGALVSEKSTEVPEGYEPYKGENPYNA